jgi:hypothetical protein
MRDDEKFSTKAATAASFLLRLLVLATSPLVFNIHNVLKLA